MKAKNCQQIFARLYAIYLVRTPHDRAFIDAATIR